MTATGLGAALQTHRLLLDRLAGALIILLGASMLIAPLYQFFRRDIRIGRLIGRASRGGPIIAGAAFALAWTPCVGPTLGAILTAAATETTVARGGLLLAVYSAGLAVPFLLTALAFDQATGAFRWLRSHYTLLCGAAGLLLIAMGLLILTHDLTRINATIQRALSGFGLNAFYLM
jgi:cytochrome c-type biogenesis protein